MNLNDFHYAMFLAHSLYNIGILPDDFEEVGLVAYRLIGNKNTRLYTACVVPDCNNIITLPCNCTLLEAVTYNFEDWNATSNKYPFGEFDSHFVENYIESLKAFTDPLYLPGKFAKYLVVGDNLILLKKDYGTKIFILYKGETLDDDGLPMLTDAEALAIATFVAYNTKFKESILTNNADIMKMALFLLAEWNRRCDAARVDFQLTQNDMDEILDIKVSWDRKRYGKSFKPQR